MSVNILDVTERINQASDIVTALVNITAPIQGPIYAEDINLSVDIVSILNKCDSLLINHAYWYTIIFIVLQKLLLPTLLLMIHSLR